MPKMEENRVRSANSAAASGYAPAKRQSNLELLRIVGMLLIIAHHYVVNTGIMDHLALAEHPSRVLFLTLWGMWGKTGINVFILISGYFMCRSNLTIRRYCQIAFEWAFYRWGIYVIMLAAGYETFSGERIFKLLFSPFIYANGSGNFSSSFLIFYLFIPFLNCWIRSANRGEYRRLVLLLLFVFTGLSTFFGNGAIFGEVFWFCAVYLMGGYLHLYPPAWSGSLRQSARLLLISWLVDYASIFILAGIALRFGYSGALTYFVADANKLGAVLVSVFLFCTFKNLQIPYSKGINLVAKTTFGVLLIHANSEAQRTFMWRDLLHVDASYELLLPFLMLRSAVIVCGVFVVCSLLDLIRIYAVERPVFRHFDWFERKILLVWSGIKKVLQGIYDMVLKLV